MLPLLLATAEAAHAAASEPGIVEKFGLEPKYVVIQAISFLIVLGTLYKFAIKPTIATMDERAKQIDSGLKYAAEMQAKLAATQQETAALIRTAQLDAQKIVDESRKAAKELAERQQKDTADRVADMLVKGQQAIELEHRKMLDHARGEIARLVVTTTERVLAKKLTDSDRAAYNEAATKELTVI